MTFQLTLEWICMVFQHLILVIWVQKCPSKLKWHPFWSFKCDFFTFKNWILTAGHGKVAWFSPVWKSRWLFTIQFYRKNFANWQWRQGWQVLEPSGHSMLNWPPYDCRLLQRLIQSQAAARFEFWINRCRWETNWQKNHNFALLHRKSSSRKQSFK